MSEQAAFFWIGVACVAVSAMQVAYAVTAVILGWLLKKTKLFYYYLAYTASMTDKDGA